MVPSKFICLNIYCLPSLKHWNSLREGIGSKELTLRLAQEMALVLSCNIEQHCNWAKETTVSNTLNNTVLAVSNIEAHKYERRIKMEWGFGNNCTTDIHKGM